MDTRFLALSLVVVPTLASVLSLQGAPVAPTARIAIVSGQRLIAGSAEARAVLERSQARQRQAAADLRTRQQALEATRRELAAAKDPRARAELEKREAQQVAELKSEASEAQTDVAAAQRQMQADLQTILSPVLNELGKERNIELILNADVAVLWGARHLDLTNDVIQRINSRKPAD